LPFGAAGPGVPALGRGARPDERLRMHGPGRVYYEGPAGDFTLCEFTVTAGGQRVPIKQATASFAARGFTADKAIDGHPQSGWSVGGGPGGAPPGRVRPGEAPGAGGVRVGPPVGC